MPSSLSTEQTEIWPELRAFAVPRGPGAGDAPGALSEDGLQARPVPARARVVAPQIGV